MSSTRQLKAARAQAAMEFLMTYGWAILVVLVVIGALAYFGVLSPSNLLPEKCTFPVGMSCVDFNLDADPMTIILQNGMGRDISVTKVTLSSQALGDGSGGNKCSQMPPTATTLTNGARVTFSLANGEDIATACVSRNTGKDKNKYNASVFYSWLDSPGVQHQAIGEILAKKQK